MIKDDFYQSSVITDTIELTDTITDLNLTDSTIDPAHAYYMGAITGDAAKLFTPKQLYIDTENVGFRDSGVQVNWGIIEDSTSSYSPNEIFYNRNDNKWVASRRFFNKLNAYSTRVPGGVTLYFSYQAKHTVEQSTIGSIVYGDRAVYFNRQIESVSMTAQQFFDFIENDTPIVVNNCTIKYSTLNDGRYWEEAYNNTTYIITLIGFIQGNWQSYYTPDTSYHPNPFIGVKYNLDTVLRRKGYIGTSTTTMPEILLDFNGHAYCRNHYYNSDSKTADSNYNISSGSYVSCAGDLKYNINKIDWSDRQSYPVVLFADDFSGIVMRNTSASNVTIDGVSYGRFIYFPILRLVDIYKYFCIFWRTSATGATTTFALYSTGDLITIYDRTNNPIRKEVFSDYASIEQDLRPWQKYGHDISENDYDPDNPPSPEPGGDTPGDEPQDLPHDDGDPPELQKDRYIGVPAMFITQYALTSGELQTVGSNLWTSWLTVGTDVWKNFFLPYAQDFGTLNIGAALDFIVSLKVFPFEFTVQYYTMTNGVRMGTGHTDFLGDSAPVIHSQIICIDAGTLKVELPNPYNDFRDMFNCSALCFMPYCGTVELNLQEILGRTLKASYFIDLQSGGCTCVIECEGDEGDYVIASKTGQIGFTLPMTATNAGQLAAQAMSDATKAIGTLSGFFFDSGKTIGNNLTSAISAQLGKKTGISEKGEVSLLSGNTFETSTKLGQSAVNTGLSLANQVIDMLSRSAVEMPMLSGGGSAESFMFADCVSLQIRRGKYKKPDNYPHSVGHYNLSSHPISYFKGAFEGSPSTGSDTGKGLCMFTGIDTTGLDCRDDERAEIISLLESGVYL